MQTTGRVLITVDHFKEDLGKISQSQKTKVIAILRVFMQEIRKILKKSVKKVDPAILDVKECCLTCAFAPSTDNLPGFPPTAYALLWAFVHGRPFICHSNQPDWKEKVIVQQKINRCSGFQTVDDMSCAKAVELAVGSMLAIERIVPTMKKGES